MRKIHCLVSVLFLLSIFGCSGDNSKKETIGETKIKLPQQLNISILIDLSDRITVKNQINKDTTIIMSIAEMFKNHIKKKKLFYVRDQIKVFFYPSSNNSEIAGVAEKLAIRLDPANKPELKHNYENLISDYRSGITSIYEMALNDGNKKGYPGSDIWRFFKQNATDFCVDKSPEYRNILIVLTDGYMYFDNSVNRIKNRTSYLTGPFLSGEHFRNNPNWVKKFEENDYGFISEASNLNNLEVLVLEVNPSKQNLVDEDIIKKYWGKWFTEMGIEKFKIYSTELPVHTKKLIEGFVID